MTDREKLLVSLLSDDGDEVDDRSPLLEVMAMLDELRDERQRTAFVNHRRED